MIPCNGHHSYILEASCSQLKPEILHACDTVMRRPRSGNPNSKAFRPISKFCQHDVDSRRARVSREPSLFLNPLLGVRHRKAANSLHRSELKVPAPRRSKMFVVSRESLFTWMNRFSPERFLRFTWDIVNLGDHHHTWNT